jgi:hypothetical protein
MKLLYKFCAVSKVSGWLPAIVPSVVALPFDEVLELITIFAAVVDTFDFIFRVVVDGDGFRRWQVMSMDVVLLPWGESIHVEDWVLMHQGWEGEPVGKLSGAFQDFVWAQLSWRELATRGCE